MSGEGSAVPVVMCWCIPGSPVVPVTIGHRKSARCPEMPRATPPTDLLAALQRSIAAAKEHRARVTPPTETEEGDR